MSKRSLGRGIRRRPRETEGAIPHGLAGLHHCEGDGVAGTPDPADAFGTLAAVFACLLAESRRLDGGPESFEGSAVGGTRRTLFLF